MPAALASVVIVGLIGMSGWPWNLFRRDRPAEGPALNQPVDLVGAAERGHDLLQRGAVFLDRSEYARAQDLFVSAGHAFHFVITNSDRTKHPGAYLAMGHAKYLAGNLPAAIASYRAGLAVECTHKQLREALEFARSRVDYTSAPGIRPQLPNGWISPRLIADCLFCFCAMTYSVGWFIGTSWLVTRSTKSAKGSVACFTLALVFGLAAWGVAECVRFEERCPFVVVQDEGAAFRHGNGMSYPPIPELPYLNRGMEARLLHTRGDWVQIQLPTGQIGWVPREKVLVG